ncbi:hypothetical protein NTGM5_330015 [Candidatus Nitrotoga sp. M5]|nr:hypothetical protein NTGM5_330015 [Candidatus Nitrotoga sp. M5]
MTQIKKAKNGEIDSLVLLHFNTHCVQLFLDVMERAPLQRQSRNGTQCLRLVL